MKQLEWKDDYALGILAVDLQHKSIFDCLITIAGGSPEHDKLLAEFAIVRLVSLLHEHFALEESMMRTFRYPELERHIAEHREFHAEVHDLAQKSVRSKHSLSLVTIATTQKWLREHIMTSDRHYIDFLADPAGLKAAKNRRAG